MTAATISCDGIHLPWGAPTARGRFLGRRKRFFIDAVLDDGTTVVAHTANTGSMAGLLREGAPVLFSRHDKKSRALPLELEAIHVGSSWVACNTIRANRSAELLLARGALPELGPIREIAREVKHGASRIDFLITSTTGDRTFVEVKSVTLREGSLATFPDAPSERAHKHVEELRGIVQEGGRAALLFMVQRTDTDAAAPAWSVDADYAALLLRAAAAGVQVLSARMAVGDEGLAFAGRLPVVLTRPSSAPTAPLVS